MSLNNNNSMGVGEWLIDITAKTAQASDRYVGPLRTAILDAGYKESHGVPPSHVIGEREMPQYDAPPELEEGSVQATLDSYRAHQQFLDAVPSLDAEMRQERGVGISTALLYGSNVRGTAMLEDAAAYETGAGKDSPSDIDWLLVLDQVEADTVSDERTYLGDEIAALDHNVRPEIHGYEEFLSELEGARASATDSQELRHQWATIRWPDRTTPIPYTSRFRPLIEGFIPHPEYSDDRVMNEIRTGLDILLTEDETVHDDMQPDMALCGLNTSGTTDRLIDLEQNRSTARRG